MLCLTVLALAFRAYRQRAFSFWYILASLVAVVFLFVWFPIAVAGLDNMWLYFRHNGLHA